MISFRQADLKDRLTPQPGDRVELTPEGHFALKNIKNIDLGTVKFIDHPGQIAVLWDAWPKQSILMLPSHIKKTSRTVTADLADRIKKYDLFYVTFIYDDKAKGADRFYFNSIDHIEGNAGKAEEDRKWDLLHHDIPVLLLQERELFPNPNTEDSKRILTFIINRLNSEYDFLKAKLIGEEVERDFGSGVDAVLHKFIVEIRL